MMKTLLVVHGLMGMDPYSVTMETLAECNKAAAQIVKQDDSLRVICLPARNKEKETQQKLNTMFSLFAEMISKMKSMEYDYCLEKRFDENCSVQSPR